jgi:hypothetical protein
MTLPLPTVFVALARGFDGECTFCLRLFDEAA